MFAIRIFKNKIISDNNLLLRVVQTQPRQPQRNFRVAVLGAAGQVGQAISLLFKQNPLITQLALYDVAKVTPGVAVDLSHMDTCSRIQAYVGPEKICGCLRDTHVVVITAGLPIRPFMSQDELFKKNGYGICELMSAIAKFCPRAVVVIITNPLNYILPLACEVMSKHGVLDPNRVFGVTTLNLVRAATFASYITCVDPACQYVPVIGGHEGESVVPLLSRSSPPLYIDDSIRDDVTRRIQFASIEVIQAKACIGSPTLSMAFAGARFTNSVLRGLMGHPNIIECALVMSGVTEAPCFATPLVLGRCGAARNLGLGIINDYERELVAKAITILKKTYCAAGEPNVIECALVMSDVTDAPCFASPLVLGMRGAACNLGIGTINDYEKELVAKAVTILKKNHRAAQNFYESKGPCP